MSGPHSLPEFRKAISSVVSTPALAIALGFGLALGPAAPHGYSGETLSEELHHLRNAEPREWAHYPEHAEGERLELAFTTAFPTDREQILCLRQKGTKQNWELSLNGKKLGVLERDHNDLEARFRLPADSLKPGDNRLTLASASPQPDDIEVGDIRLLSPEEEAHSLGTLRLSAQDRATQTALPCRFTIIGKNGTLPWIKTPSSDRAAIRSGVVYALKGEAFIDLPAGDYLVTAGRGFEYSLERAPVRILAGQSAETTTFRLERQVPTPGLVACDTHLHTYEFARHGDATLKERLITLAGEGIELAISTEHEQYIGLNTAFAISGLA